MSLKNIHDKVNYFASYSMKLTSTVLNDFLHDYAEIKTDEPLVINRDYIHQKLTTNTLYDILKNDKFKNKIYFAETNNKFIFFKLNVIDLFKEHI